MSVYMMPRDKKTENEDGTFTYDYADGMESVTLIVREGNTYGTAPAGSKVLIAKEHLHDRSIHRACMTQEEHDEIEAEKKRRAEARKPKPGMLKAGVDAFLAGLKPRDAVAQKRSEEEPKQRGQAYKMQKALEESRKKAANDNAKE